MSFVRTHCIKVEFFQISDTGDKLEYTCSSLHKPRDHLDEADGWQGLKCYKNRVHLVTGKGINMIFNGTYIFRFPHRSTYQVHMPLLLL